MKQISKFLLAVLICIGCLYYACKKSQTVATNSNAITLSSQVAVNLYKVLATKFSGTAINTGAKVFGHSGLTVNAANSLCGYKVDTTYSYKTTSGDTTHEYSGHYIFIYTCSNNNVDGYITADSLLTAESGARFANSYKMAQNYTVKILGSNNLLFGVDGSIATVNHTSTLNISHNIVQYHDLNTVYNLQSIKIDLTSAIADITTGSATFSCTQTDLNPIPNSLPGYNGTITFLGNHKARVTLHAGADNSTLIVNLLTGAVSAI